MKKTKKELRREGIMSLIELDPKMSQKEISERCGVTERTINRDFQDMNIIWDNNDGWTTKQNIIQNSLVDVIQIDNLMLSRTKVTDTIKLHNDIMQQIKMSQSDILYIEFTGRLFSNELAVYMNDKIGQQAVNLISKLMRHVHGSKNMLLYMNIVDNNNIEWLKAFEDKTLWCDKFRLKQHINVPPGYSGFNYIRVKI